VTEQLIQTLETEALSKSDKFSKLSPVPLAQKNAAIRTLIFESDSADVFAAVRVYDKSDSEDHVLVTLSVDIKT
jgi:hypothetical protein